MAKIKSRRKRKRLVNNGSQKKAYLYGKGIQSNHFNGGLSIDIGKLSSAQIKEMVRLFKTPTRGIKFTNP